MQQREEGLSDVRVARAAALDGRSLVATDLQRNLVPPVVRSL